MAKLNDVRLSITCNTMDYLLVHDHGDGTYNQMGVDESFKIGDIIDIKRSWNDPVQAYRSFAPFISLCLFEINEGTSIIQISDRQKVNGDFHSSHGDIWIKNGKRSRKVKEGPAHISKNWNGYLNKNLVRTSTVRYEHYFENGHVVTGPSGYSSISFDRFDNVVKTFNWEKKYD